MKKELQNTTFSVRGHDILLIQNGKLTPSKRFTEKTAKDYADRYIEREYRQKIKHVNLEATSDIHPTTSDLAGFPRVLISGTNRLQKVLLLQDLILEGFRIESRRQRANVSLNTDYSLVRSDEMQSKEIAVIEKQGVEDFRRYVGEYNEARDAAIKSLKEQVQRQKELSDKAYQEAVNDKQLEDNLLNQLLTEIEK
ncbi:hypothetical protein [Photobacterium halotolerans]|uniref:Uncharacterized protein n=1 Tax=Photobacterium halotolerans TaxID=265726 RepID=A0A0F5VIT2_9GAMM|nr:hypothetical protein [Photobacterium halotolerans]KKD01420.1 hypothetical protein KY46_00900 [Photobacterium halotolerans]